MKRPSIRTNTRFAATAILGGLLAINCGGGGDADVGHIKLALALPGGITINSVDWKVLSSTSAVLQMGTINTSDPNIQPSVIVGLAAGVGDIVTMSAVTSTNIACSGTSDAFNVVPGASVNVPVNITCGQTTAGTGLGSVDISATVVPGDQCPVATAYLITPASAMSPSGTISVSVSGSDPDMGETVTFAWTASAGTFADPTSATTTYTCTTAGMQTLSAAITDSHTPPCTTHLTFPVVNCQ
jgi:hypothetical protein